MAPSAFAAPQQRSALSDTHTRLNPGAPGGKRNETEKVVYVCVWGWIERIAENRRRERERPVGLEVGTHTQDFRAVVKISARGGRAKMVYSNKEKNGGERDTVIGVFFVQEKVEEKVWEKKSCAKSGEKSVLRSATWRSATSLRTTLLMLTKVDLRTGAKQRLIGASVRHAGDHLVPVGIVRVDILMMRSRPWHGARFGFQLRRLRHVDHLVVLVELVDGPAGSLGFLGRRTLAVVLIERVVGAGLAVAGGGRV